MQKKQTAVELLEQQLKERYSLMNSEPLFEQAKQMEKEQTISAVKYGCSDWGSAKDAESYYNETYGETKN
jgi:hypothetical protein